MLLLNQNYTIEQISVVVAAILIVGGIGYLIKMLLSKSVDRYFKALDKRDAELDDYKKIVDEQRELTLSLIRKVDNLISELRNYKDISHEKEKNNNFKFSKIENEMATSTTVEKEHYNELKGKISKVHTRIGDVDSKINYIDDKVDTIEKEVVKLKTEHNHNHGKSI